MRTKCVNLWKGLWSMTRIKNVNVSFWGCIGTNRTVILALSLSSCTSPATMFSSLFVSLAYRFHLELLSRQLLDGLQAHTWYFAWVLRTVSKNLSFSIQNTCYRGRRPRPLSSEIPLIPARFRSPGGGWKNWEVPPFHNHSAEARTRLALFPCRGLGSRTSRWYSPCIRCFPALARTCAASAPCHNLRCQLCRFGFHNGHTCPRGCIYNER